MGERALYEIFDDETPEGTATQTLVTEIDFDITSVIHSEDQPPPIPFHKIVARELGPS